MRKRKQLVGIISLLRRNMSQRNIGTPTFPPACAGYVIHRGACKGPSQSFNPFKKEGDRFLVIQMHKVSRVPEVHEWKSSAEPSPAQPPSTIMQLTPGITQLLRVRDVCVGAFF